MIHGKEDSCTRGGAEVFRERLVAMGAGIPVGGEEMRDKGRRKGKRCALACHSSIEDITASQASSHPLHGGCLRREIPLEDLDDSVSQGKRMVPYPRHQKCALAGKRKD